MARPLRIEIPDGVYHVTSSGLEKRRIAADDADRENWTELLGAVCRRFDWRVFAWALMDNHFHLFLRTPHADLSTGMHDLNSGYASRFNGRHRRSGPLFQGRFKGILVERDYHYWELTRYIHLNPVRAGLARDPEGYAWSSCRCYFEERGAPEWLAWEEALGEHGRSLREARRRYRKYLAEGISSRAKSPLEEARASTLLGSADFLGKMGEWLRDRTPERDVPAARELGAAISVEEIERAVCRAYGISPEALRRRGSRGNEARGAAIYLSRGWTRLRGEELGAYFGGIKGQAISNTVAKISRARQGVSALDARLRKVEASLRKI
ncbi:MAG: transposase [Planctomycetota bacterium]